ncbi:hypothetical protein POSPLADRAFT_1032196 [Postia placenta MAD-698-R-SB12]|uniref:Uncharacterized protein n=1 Tax=Postia placenta MAD-698-R-SB12 TaxID=670580 RepID=A0A1X6NAI0_9APHY|nr:hypothetical protein POSPLADRAFT_1032196 [Postia placenta MAD-698-R-SB12]OSX65446.1 hypothetical protein POSPLADRAFT_1032196 [Postia placenta MAD-698-R-SB12]
MATRTGQSNPIPIPGHSTASSHAHSHVDLAESSSSSGRSSRPQSDGSERSDGSSDLIFGPMDMTPPSTSPVPSRSSWDSGQQFPLSTIPPNNSARSTCASCTRPVPPGCTLCEVCLSHAASASGMNSHSTTRPVSGRRWSGEFSQQVVPGTSQSDNRRSSDRQMRTRIPLVTRMDATHPPPTPNMLPHNAGGRSSLAPSVLSAQTQCKQTKHRSYDGTSNVFG